MGTFVARYRQNTRPQALGLLLGMASSTILMAASNANAQQTDWTVSLDRQSLATRATPFSAFESPQRYNDTNSQAPLNIETSGWRVRDFDVAATPLAFSRPDTQQSRKAIEWRHDWTAVHERTPSGLEVSLTPHAGLGVIDGRSLAEAGATLRLGQGLEDLAPDGDSAFGNKPRWYVFASGSRRAVGYNFTRRSDGGFNGEGLSQDSGHSLGDAAIGVAWRRGAMHSSVGLVYRELETEGLRGYSGIKTDVSEGLLAFQFAFRPQ